VREAALLVTENVLGATDAARGFYSGHDGAYLGDVPAKR